jgi:hypothetical protein
MSKNLPEAIGSFRRTGKSFEKFQNPGTREVLFTLNI